MKPVRFVILFIGLVNLAAAIGYIFRIPIITGLWPWPDGRLSYLFLGSILAAISVAALWIGWSGELGALPAGSLNIFVIAATFSFFSLRLASQENLTHLFLYSFIFLLMAIVSLATFLWSRRFELRDPRPTPLLIRVSFGIFVVSLLLAGSALVMQVPVFPWKLDPKSSVMFGCIFLGDAFYFMYGLFYPRWHNALGQLLSFLAYDLVLIFPFLLLFKTVKPEFKISLTVYVAVLVYSAALAVYYLFINQRTRIWSPSTR